MARTRAVQGFDFVGKGDWRGVVLENWQVVVPPELVKAMHDPEEAGEKGETTAYYLLYFVLSLLGSLLARELTYATTYLAGCWSPGTGPHQQSWCKSCKTLFDCSTIFHKEH
jgi:hypothetical protein